ncbi:MFS transporter [Actinoallomurus sp. NPDC052308]|uniref:MFS transporter n=1 Tax=Actinoallomurus sp. NPDC052308 TaxID=3155530 RepID=UPI00341276C6
MVFPLRGNPRYWRYWLAGLASSAGTAMATGAVAAAVLDHGGGAGGVAMVLMGQMVAQIIMLPIGGGLADRLPRIRLIVAVEMAIGALVAVQATLIASGHARVLSLALIAGGVSVAGAFAEPARVGLITDLVPAEHRQQANALAKLTHYSMITCGPSAGGVVVATAGPAWGVGVNAASFWASGLLLIGITVPPAHRAASRFAADLAQGWRLVARTPWIAWKVAAGSVVVAGWHLAYGIVGLTYVQTRLGGPAAWGLIASSLGLGMVAGSLIALSWTPRRAGYANCVATVPMALPGACMAVAAPLPVIAAAVALAAAGLAVAMVTWRSVIQRNIPEALQGRVAAWTTIGEIGLAPVAYLLVAPATTALGLRTTLAVCAIAISTSALAPLLHPSVRHLTFDAAPSPERTLATPSPQR